MVWVGSLALALTSGALYGLLFPPASLGFLAWVVLVPLLLALRGRSPFQAALCGGVWALVATGAVAWWFPGMLERYFGLAGSTAWLGLIAAGLVINALPYMAFGAWVAWYGQRRALHPLAVGAAWALAEFARAHGWLANPVGLIGYSQVGTPFAQLADLAGPYGIAALVVAVNAALLDLLAPTSQRRWRSAAVTAGLVVLALGYGELRLGQRFADGDPVRVAVVQGGIARELEWDREKRSGYLERYLELTRSTAEFEPELVFWPEFAVDFYLNEATRHRTRLVAAVQELDTELLTGAAHYRFEDGKTRYYNSVFLLDRQGRVADRYDKVRLIPFAEYGPVGGWLRGATAMYAPGSEHHSLPAAGARVGAFICGEALFPEIARALVRGGAEVLANPSNDYWFGHPAASLYQLQMASLRAIETRRYLVRPTATGVSAVVDPHGRAVATSVGEEAQVLEAVLRPSRSNTPYLIAGDAALGVAFVLLIGGTLIARRPSPFGGES